MADDPTRARQRRTLAYAFSQKALTEQESILQGYVNKLISNLRSMLKEKKPANLVNVRINRFPALNSQLSTFSLFHATFSSKSTKYHTM
jgi:cytochrome P450